MKKYTILHLDDNQVFIDEMRLLLNVETEEIDYIGVKSVNDAWEELTRHLPDLLIVDLMLENDYDPQPGIDFIREVRDKLSPDLKIVVLTANTDKNPRTELEGLVDWHETKSFTPSQLREKIKEILRTPRGVYK
jgi:CheY-like chemotaxis protein